MFFPKWPDRRLLSLLVLTLALVPGAARAIDLTKGLMSAVPVPSGSGPAFDGTDQGWDLSGAEPAWYSNQLALQMNGKLALNYDDANLYVYARVSLPNRKLTNLNGPSDPYWQGDLLELRLGSDPALPYPLNRNTPAVRDSNRVCHVSIWKDTETGTDYMAIIYGDSAGTSQGHVINPPGVRFAVTEGAHDYTVQAKIPWRVLNVPGGKNPFRGDQRMTATFGLHWRNATLFYSLAALYASNPGDFSFMNWQTWGQVEFSPSGSPAPRHPSMDEALVQATGKSVGVPISVTVPEQGKISVNIVGDNGEVVRELVGGQEVQAGNFTTYWDGKDQWGFGLPPGDYRWGAYFSHGLKARYIGSVGSSGNPPYPTSDGKGGWGGDHGVPCAVAADASGLYLGWTSAEAERQLVKVDYTGRTLWRKTPFVPGGFAVLTAIGVNGSYLFAVYDGTHPRLIRIDAKTGAVAGYGKQLGEEASVMITSQNTPVAAPPGSLPAQGEMSGTGAAPECLGLVATDKEIFASVYSRNEIQVLDVATGQRTRTLACPSPRGLALDGNGHLYAVSYGTAQRPQIVRFDGLQGDAKPVITSGLEAPLGVAIDASGQLWVTDLGASQQIKIFNAFGKPVTVLGREGGRSWIGTYDPTSFRDPTAITSDPQGGINVAESSVPKLFDRIEAASGKTLARWFGYPAYGISNIGDCDDPMTSYYPYEPQGFARATVPGQDKTGFPDAYWVLEQVLKPDPIETPGLGDPQAFVEGMNQTYGYSMLPYVSRLDNGRKYFIDDGNPHLVSLIEGDKMVPVGYLDVRFPDDHRTPHVTRPLISIWTDLDATHRPTSGSVTTLTQVEGKPLPPTSGSGESMWMAPNGDAYFLTHANSILKIPSDGFTPEGAIRWNAGHATIAVPVVLPGNLDFLPSGQRMGLAGLRADAQGNIYTCLSATVPVLTPELAAKIQQRFPGVPQSQWCVYANAEIAQKMHEGLGHTAESNAVKFVKFGPDGKLRWIAGRKATAAPGPGEMYHFWSVAGMVDDRYFAGASEWGPIYFYTTDGYFVDAIMEDPAALAPAGPYTFGSETFSGRIESYDKLGKVYAYDEGGIYAVEGFGSNMKVEGEKRFTGTVHLDKVYEQENQSAVASSLIIAPLTGDGAKDATWDAVPKETLDLGSGREATVQLGYDQASLHARFHVMDETPLQNEADDINTVFKGGDVVGLDFGPAKHDKLGMGDVRILAAMIHGRPHLIAMKPISNQTAQPQQYSTPASGTRSFAFVGDIPGGVAQLVTDGDGKGYTAELTVPKSALECMLTPGTTLSGDVEVLLSGVKSQGVQTVSRHWLFSGGHVETTMVDDIPTEAWLYPRFWGKVEVK